MTQGKVDPGEVRNRLARYDLTSTPAPDSCQEVFRGPYAAFGFTLRGSRYSTRCTSTPATSFSCA